MLEVQLDWSTAIAEARKQKLKNLIPNFLLIGICPLLPKDSMLQVMPQSIFIPPQEKIFLNLMIDMFMMKQQENTTI